MITQLSVFLQNKPGELMKVTKLLADEKIQIRALTVAETADYGILRIIVDKPEKCYEILKSKNILVGKTNVLAVEMVDKPGGLNDIAHTLGENGCNIEYLYAFVAKERAVLVLQISESHFEKAQDILGDNLIPPEEIYNL